MTFAMLSKKLRQNKNKKTPQKDEFLSADEIEKHVKRVDDCVFQVQPRAAAVVAFSTHMSSRTASCIPIKNAVDNAQKSMLQNGLAEWASAAGKALTLTICWRLLSMTGQIKCNKACCKTRKNENQ